MYVRDSDLEISKLCAADTPLGRWRTDYKNGQPDYVLTSQAKVGVWVTDFTQDIGYNSDPGGSSDVGELAPASDPGLAWATAQAPGTGSDFALRNWSLLGGIAPADQTPGDYYIYARFLDGAGNPTIGVFTTSITPDRHERPVVYLCVALMDVIYCVPSIGLIVAMHCRTLTMLLG